MENNEALYPRKFLARICFGWLFLTLIYFYASHSLVHQWEQPILIYPEADNTYWLLHMLNIPQWIMQSKTWSLVFDLLMIASTFLFFLFPEKILWAIISILTLWLFQVMYGSSNGHHYHHIGYLLIPLPFIFRNPVRFSLSWQIVRYWILFLFFCSGLYKLYYGGFFEPYNMSRILMQGNVADENFKSRVILSLIEHPQAAQLLYQLATLLQLCCLLGFISRKYDRLIFWLLLVFNLSNYFLMNFPFWENSLVLAPFLGFEQSHKCAPRRDL